MIQRTITRLLLLFGCFCCAQFGFGQSDSTQIGITRRTVVKAPVVPFYDTLFYIDANIGSFSAEERAASVAEKIRMISRESGFHRDSVKVVVFENIAEIVFKDNVIMGVTPVDAYGKGESQLTMAQEYGKIIGEAVAERKQKRNWRYILFRIFSVALIIAGLYFLIKYINRLFRQVSEKIEKQKDRKIRAIRLKSFNLMDEKQTTKLILSCIRIIRYLVIGILIYLSFPVIFSIFPPTRGIVDKLFKYVLYPVQKIFTSVIEYIPNLITIIVIVFVFRYLIRGLRYIAREISKGRLTIRGFYPDWAYPTFSIIKTLLYAFMFIVIFPYLPGSESRVFQGVSVFVGIVFSLGSSSVISNVVSGLVITYMRSFRVGDWIKIGDIVGNVTEKTPFVTRIRTPKNEVVTVPNSSIMSAQTLNYSHSTKGNGLILYTKVTFGYDIPWRQVHQLLLDAAAQTSNIMKEPKPFVLQTALDDFYAEYQINVFTHDADRMPEIYSELYQHIQDVFNEAGIELVVPHYAAHRDGHCTVLPPEYRPDDYHVPPFNVNVTNAEKNG